MVGVEVSIRNSWAAVALEPALSAAWADGSTLSVRSVVAEVEPCAEWLCGAGSVAALE